MGPDSMTSPSRSLKDPFVIGSRRYAEHLMNSTPLIPTWLPCSIDKRINASRSLETFPLTTDWPRKFKFGELKNHISSFFETAREFELTVLP